MADWRKLYCSTHDVTSDAFDWQEDVTDFEDTHTAILIVFKSHTNRRLP